MTKLEIINRIIQIFCIRITKCRQTVIKSATIRSISLVKDGVYGVEYEPNDIEYIWFYQIAYWIVPFTGWSDNKPYKYIGKQTKCLYYKIWPLSDMQKSNLFVAISLALTVPLLILFMWIIHTLIYTYPI